MFCFQVLPEIVVNFIKKNIFHFIYFNSFFFISFVTLCKSLCISNVPAVLFVKRILTNFAKFTENTFQLSCWDSACNLIKKKRLWHRCFPVNLSKFLRKSTFQNTSGRLTPCFVSFSENLAKMIPQYFRKVVANLASKSLGCRNRYQHIVI